MGREEKDRISQDETNEKVKRPKRKSNRVMRMILCVMQHMLLGIAVTAMLIVAGGSRVSIDGFRGERSSLTFNLLHQNRNVAYEDSEMFNTIFGYMMADIVRYGVVSSQLETDGSFDGSKVIDVTAFNYRDSGLPETYVTAEYRLEDLLKWAHYGFEWSASEMTPEQAKGFLADKTRATSIDQSSQYYNTADAGYLKSDIGEYTFVNDVSSNQLWMDSDDYDGFVDGYGTSAETGRETGALTEQPDTDADESRTYDILINRYKTAENKNLEEYVSDWALYYDLCHNVQNAAESLSYNYDEYQDYRDYYDPQNTNVRYVIMKTVGDKTQLYSNLNDRKGLESVVAYMSANGDEKAASIDQWGKYIFYSPADMIYRTNTAVNEETVHSLLQSYDYAYPESVKLWVNVDTDYPVADAFKQGEEGFLSYMPYFWQLLVLSVISVVIYFLLLVYLSVAAGRETDGAGKLYIRLSSFDHVPTELALLLAGGAALLAGALAAAVVITTGIDPTNLTALGNDLLFENWFMALLFVFVFAVDSAAMFFYYSLVRRIKTRMLWKNSLLRRLVHKAKEFVWNVYDNGSIVLRTWVPFAILLAVNGILLMMAAGVGDAEVRLIFVILTAVFDILAGSLLYKNAKEQQEIVESIRKIADGQLEHQIKTENLHGYNRILADSVNSIGNGIKEAVEISMKDERMKADLITNVSHDIKTPLTSIINYVDLIKREQVENEKVRGYINVLDEKSQRLKQLTDDLVEASKISSGNISLNFEKINLIELMNQTIGEFSEKFEAKNLSAVMNVHAKKAVIEADSRRIWRVMENLFNNIYKYAMEGTRVYLSVDDASDKAGYIEVSVKNISAAPLNCDPDELTERFIRGDESRTTEGSGLGLSIAKNLTEAQKGTFEIQLDGDLFKVLLTFPLAGE